MSHEASDVLDKTFILDRHVKRIIMEIVDAV